MPMNEELERRTGDLYTARDAVQKHLSSAVRAWRNDPADEPLGAITEDWMLEHDRLKERVEDVEQSVINRLLNR